MISYKSIWFLFIAIFYATVACPSLLWLSSIEKWYRTITHIHYFLINYDYQVALYSKDGEEELLTNYRRLQVACNHKGIPYFSVYAMAVYDQQGYPNTSSSEPVMKERDGIRIAGWGLDNRPSNRTICDVLESLLTIQEQDRERHIVLECEKTNVATFREQGYSRSYLVSPSDPLTIEDELDRSIAVANARAQYLSTTSLSFFNEDVIIEDVSQQLEHVVLIQ